MAFRAFSVMKDFVEESELDPVPTTEGEINEPTSTKNELWKFTRGLWKRVGTIMIILFTILAALAINALVQSILLGVSPNKDHSSVVLIIISQFLYGVLVTIGLVAAILLVAQQEATTKRAKEKETVLAVQPSSELPLSTVGPSMAK